MPKKSFVWKHFDITSIKDKAKCKHCSDLISWKGTTTNMMRHIKFKHKSVWNELERHQNNDDAISQFSSVQTIGRST